MDMEQENSIERADVIESQMLEINAELSAMDYLTSKELDGEDMSEYGDYKTKRKALRKAYRELEQQLRALQGDDTEG